MRIFGLSTIMLFMAFAYLVSAKDEQAPVSLLVEPPEAVAAAAGEDILVANGKEKEKEEAPASFLVESIVLRSIFGK